MGPGNLAGLMAGLPPALRLLHLAGEDHIPNQDRRIDRRIVYRSATIADPGLPPLADLVAAIHSPRAGARLSEVANDRRTTIIAAISEAAAAACGSGWEEVGVAGEPNDKSLLVLAASLCHKSDQ